MTDKERIIIDGVDVSECEQITYKKSLNPMCGNTWFCCYGRENCYFKQLARKTAECKELQEKVDYSHNDNIRWSEAWLKMWRQRSRYLKALEEIEGIAKGMRSIFIEEVSITASQLNDRIYRETTERFRQILDIISKANPTKNKRGGK
jgi:hypothetical protein